MGSFGILKILVMKCCFTLFFNYLFVLTSVFLQHSVKVLQVFQLISQQKETIVSPQSLAIQNTGEVLHGKMLFHF